MHRPIQQLLIARCGSLKIRRDQLILTSLFQQKNHRNREERDSNSSTDHQS
jgi:hypothetical protein